MGDKNQMSKDKVTPKVQSLSSRGFIELLSRRIGVKLFSILSLKRLLVIVWQKDKKRKQDYCESLSSSITNMYLHKNIRKCAKFEIDKKLVLVLLIIVLMV